MSSVADCQPAARRVGGAAARLGLPDSTLESKIRRYRIDHPRYRISRV